MCHARKIPEEEKVVYSFEYLFYPDSQRVSVPDFYDGDLSAFLGALVRNGQLIDQHWNMIEEVCAIRLYCIAPEEDSLDPKYYNDYCKEYFSKVAKLSSREPEYRMIGHTVGLSDSCTCEAPSFYVLFTNFLAEYSPVTCGMCNLPVPLYKLPFIGEDKEYNSILFWYATYQTCDNLFILSDIGKRFGYQQISKVDSCLSKKGIEICKEMSMKTQKPFYYFLHKHYGRQKKVCPICGVNWTLPSPLHNLYSYKCDNCCLVADRPKIDSLG